MMDANESRRRRSRGSVTRNACIECRKRKARCDGQKPCARCSSVAGLACSYTVSIQVSKEAMRSEIEDLQEYRQQSERILSSLATGNQSDFILERLRNGESLRSLAKCLDTGTSLNGAGGSKYLRRDIDPESTLIGPISTASCNNLESNGDSFQTFQLLADEMMEDSFCDEELYKGTTWTAVTDDMEIVEHLMSLYFCWEYPVFAGFSKRHFLDDFRKGRPRYCSPLLVNAILALGCRYSDQPTFRRGLDNNLTDVILFAEAEHLWVLEQDNPPSLTTIQALSLMAIREASSGRDTESEFFSGQSIRMAVEMGLHVQSDDIQQFDEVNIRNITLWGALSLHEVWSLCSGRIPHISRKGLQLDKPVIVDADEQSEWVPYVDCGSLTASPLHQRSNVRLVFNSFCELTELAHHSLYILYDPVRALTSEAVLEIYGLYLQWYESLPRVLRLGENSTPSVLFAHMYYHFAILLLFGPFMKVRFLSSSVSPSLICLQAADAIASLVSSYRKLFTLRRTPSFVPYIVLASGIVHLAAADIASKAIPEFSVNASTHILQGTADLLEMIPSHSFARRGTQVLRVMAHNVTDAEAINNESLDVDPGLLTFLDLSKARICDDQIPSDSHEQEIEIAQGARSRAATYYFSDDMVDRMGRRYSGPTDNSIFCPFPRQVVPLAGSEKLLVRDGYILI